MPSGVALTTTSNPAGSFVPVVDLELRIVLPEPAGERLHRGLAHVIKPDLGRARSRGRGGDRRAHAARPDDERLLALERAAVPRHAAHEPFAVEHVADQPALGVAADGVAGARDLDRGRHLVDEAR